MSDTEMNNTMDLTMDGETFDDLRRNFDIVMQRLIKNMADTNSDEAKISITVDVKLDTEFVPNYKPDGGVDGGRDIKKPTFKHKVASAIAVKDEASGVRNTEMELVRDEEQSRYVLKPVLGGEQMTMNDYMSQKAESADAEPDADGQKLLEAHAPELPGPTESEDDVVEGDFREIDDEQEVPDDEPEAESEDELIEDGTDEDFDYDEPEEE